MVPRALLLATLASLLAAPFATAQGPTDPDPQLTIAVTPASSTVNPGGTTSYQISVTLSMGQPIICTGPATATVNLAFADKPSPIPGLTGTLSKNALTFQVASQAGPQAQGFSAPAQTAQFNVTAGPNVAPDHDHAFNFTASFSGTITGCNPVSSTPIPPRTASREATLRTGAGAGTSGTGTDGTGTLGGTDGTGSEAAPHLGVAGLALALAFAARRKLQ